MNIIVRSCIIFIIALNLTGCMKKSLFSKCSKNAEMTDNADMSSMQAINDPAVMAIVKSGKLDHTPYQIKHLLDKNIYYFDFDSNVLYNMDYQYLNVLAVLMDTSEYKQARLVIEGNTDQRGTRNYNIGLGFRRANAVKNYLMTLGISKDRVSVASYGFEKPADPANNPAAWKKNRRVEIVLKNAPAA